MGKGLERHFSKKDIQMAKKKKQQQQMKWCSVSLLSKCKSNLHCSIYSEILDTSYTQ